MFIGVLYVEFFVSESRSLKEKRQFIRPIKERLRNSFNVSIAEVDHQDLWQRSAVAVVCAGESKQITEETISKVKNFIDRYYPGLVLEYKTDFFKVSL